MIMKANQKTESESTGALKGALLWKNIAPGRQQDFECRQ
jgi:hypothetical protein